MPALAGGGDRGAALRTLDYGLQRKPNDPWLLIAQAQVQMQIADFASALATCSTARLPAPTTPDRAAPGALFPRPCQSRSRQLRAGGRDFDASLEGQTTLRARLGAVLWRYAAQVRGRQDARAVLARDIGNENLYEWPGPIAKFLMGRLPAGELEVAAESDDAAKKSNGKCIGRLLHRYGRRAPRRQAARARAAPARAGALPDGVGGQLGGFERAEAALARSAPAATRSGRSSDST